MGKEELLPEKMRKTLKSDIEGVIERFREMRGNRPVSDHEIETVADWVKTIRVFNSLIDMTLKGTTLIDVEGEEVAFGLTAEGEKIAESR